MYFCTVLYIIFKSLNILAESYFFNALSVSLTLNSVTDSWSLMTLSFVLYYLCVGTYLPVFFVHTYLRELCTL
jgi:hypothetical protein